ncbi:UNVERIFIED_CONTAM: hypothetical protein ACS92_06320 [Bacillus cereus]
MARARDVVAWLELAVPVRKLAVCEPHHLVVRHHLHFVPVLHQIEKHAALPSAANTGDLAVQNELGVPNDTQLRPRVEHGAEPAHKAGHTLHGPISSNQVPVDGVKPGVLLGCGEACDVRLAERKVRLGSDLRLGSKSARQRPCHSRVAH